MTTRERYTPGAAAGADVLKDGERWTLVLVRELRHPPAKVWTALTDPAQLRAWAPFDADRDLGSPGTVKLSTVGAPTPQVSETQVTRAEAPHLLEYSWGGQELRWQLEPLGAAGWHICFDVLAHHLDGDPLGRIVGADALKFGGWQRLNAEYASQFGVDPPSWPAAKP